MNQRIELSILVPTTEDHRNSRILRDYLQSQQRKNLVLHGCPGNAVRILRKK